MLYQRSSLRYAHTTGYTGLVYTKDGEFIITCGSDGDIRRWRGIDDDDPTSSCLGEYVICITQTDEGRLLASTDRNTVQAYTFPAMDNDGMLMRFTASVTCLRVHKNYVVAGSEDTTIKVYKSDVEPAEAETHFSGHKGPILALDICAKGLLLASAAGDGQLKIWNLETGSEIKSIAGLEKSNSFESAVCYGTPVFEPNHSQSLAYVKDKEVYILNTTTWEVQCTLTDERVKGNYTCCQFSNDGQFLAAGTTNGEISVFDFMRKQAIKCEAPSSECQGITSLAWHTKNNKELAYCDATGQLGTIFSADSSAEGEAADALLDNEANDVDFGDMNFDGDDLSTAQNDAADNNYDEDDGDGVSIEKLKNKIMRSAGAFSNGDLLDDEYTKNSLASTVAGSDAEISAAAVAKYLPKTFKQQVAFQPSATPVHLEHRYLVWNDIGIVTAHADSADGSINVEFHDASVHHSLHIPNYSNHTMASLSVNVLAMSAEGATKLVCIALAASGNREWSIQLPDCESVEALTASSKLVAVVTSMNFLRLYTVMGTQREIISIPGAIIVMAGHEDRIIVCYHSAPSNETQQNVAAMLIQTNGLQMRAQQMPLPLTPGRQITWLGFSDCGSPLFADSMGLVQLYSMKSNCWYPICDTMKHSQSISNNYFVVSVSERSQIVQAVLCRGTSYPMTNPRPMMQELPMHLPIGDADNEKSDLEDTLLRAAIMSVDNSEKLIKETAIKLFALACRSEIEMRAKELIETIACPDLLQLAVKYASKLGRIHLSDRLSELLPQLEEQQENKEFLDFQTHPNIPMSYHILRANSPSLSSGAISTKLAPKSMELSYAKRASLKRLSVSNTPTASNKASLKSMSAVPSTQDTESNVDTQENIYTKHSESDLDNTEEQHKEVTRTPLNSVNPFASKRKLSEVDFANKSVLLGSGKLKLVKK